MKKIFLTLLTLCFVASYGLCSTVNSYDSYGRKTGSYRTQSNGTTNIYDNCGHRTWSYKKDSNGRITKYDAYGRRVSSYR